MGEGDVGVLWQSVQELQQGHQGAWQGPADQQQLASGDIAAAEYRERECEHGVTTGAFTRAIDALLIADMFV